jgi:deoxyribonuclease-4
MQGKMDIRGIFETAEKKLGRDKLDKLHIHLSYIKYGEKGETEHTTLADTEWGYPIEPILTEIKQRNINPTIICESANIMAQDVVKIIEKYRKIRL